MKPIVIAVTDLPARQAREQCFFNGGIIVRTRSGLHPTEAALLDQIEAITAPPRHAIVTGNRSGALPLAIKLRWPDAMVAAHAYDALHAAAIRRTLATSLMPESVSVLGAPAIVAQRENAAQLVLAQISHNAMPLELVQETVQDIHEALADGGELLMACEGDAEWLRELLKKTFGKATVTVGKSIILARATRTRPLTKLKTFSATFDVSLPGQPPFSLTTIPGVFAHRRPDQGGLALAEVAAREVTPGDRILDIGSGSGMVGIALGRAQPGAHVTFLDSNWRADHCARRNAAANGLPDTAFICDHTGDSVAPEQYTLAAGNPPYFGNYAIAEHFIKTAHRALRPGGRCLMVAKTAGWHHGFMVSLYGNATTVKRREYTIVRSIRQ